MDESLEIRIREADPIDAGAIARVHVDTWRTAYAGICRPNSWPASRMRIESKCGSKLSQQTGLPRACLLRKPKRCEIVGFAYGAPEREGNLLYRGELFAIYVLKGHQRRGVGRRLFSAMARHFISQDIDSMLLWVLEDNHPARQFYELMGGEYVEQKTITIGGTDLIEVAYGWKDITEIAVE